jgi:hypothetical protein
MGIPSKLFYTPEAVCHVSDQKLKCLKYAIPIVFKNTKRMDVGYDLQPDPLLQP